MPALAAGFPAAPAPAEFRPAAVKLARDASVTRGAERRLESRNTAAAGPPDGKGPMATEAPASSTSRTSTPGRRFDERQPRDHRRRDQGLRRRLRPAAVPSRRGGRRGDSFFGGLAASGWHTAALTMRLLVETRADRRRADRRRRRDRLAAPDPPRRRAAAWMQRRRGGHAVALAPRSRLRSPSAPRRSTSTASRCRSLTARMVGAAPAANGAARFRAFHSPAKAGIAAAPAGTLRPPARLFPTPLDDIPAAAAERTGHRNAWRRNARCRSRPT